MGKKNLNPADAHRKAMRQKEKQKNKETRTKVREVTTLKKDTGGMEADIRRLEEESRAGNFDKTKQAKLSELKAEVERVKKTKSEYVSAHPEHRALVYGKESTKSAGDSSTASKDSGKGPYGKNGLLKHPERSIYYDPVMNPFGAPPPGMPYVERPLLPHEIEAERLAAGPAIETPNETPSSESDDDSSESDEAEAVPLPPGRPPGQEDSDSEGASDSDDDIPMPEGPPPPRRVANNPAPPLPPFPHFAATPPYPPMPPFPPHFSVPPPPPPGFPQLPGGIPLPPPPPPGFPGPNGMLPMQSLPPGFPYPPPPPGGPSPQPRQYNQQQDPLSSKPHQPYQSRGLPPPPFGLRHPLPPAPAQMANVSAKHLAASGGTGGVLSGGVTLGVSKPSTSATAPSTANAASSATISAAPELRDFKKESTAFVPAALKRKQAASQANTTKKMKFDAAPGMADASGAVAPMAKPDLMSTLKNNLNLPSAPSKDARGEKKKDDYDAFLEEMGDII